MQPNTPQAVPSDLEFDRIIPQMFTPERRAPRASTAQWDERKTLDSPHGPLAYWVAGTGPTVVLVHGWESSHADLDAFVAPLVAHGLRVVSLDLPAHGESAGERATFVEFATAILGLDERYGPLAGVVGHSAGCPSTALALERGLRARCVALIASPERYERFVRWFAGEAGVSPDALIAALQARGFDVTSFVMPETAARLDIPALIVHSVDDRTCDVRGARAIAAAWRGSELLEVDGLGHSRILRDPLVVERVVDFIAAH